MFFSFDGIDGTGKSTQVGLFVDWLREQGCEVAVCRDPGSTPLGEQIREILLDHSSHVEIGRLAEMFLYMAARAQLIEEVVRPAMARGDIVVADRFVLANVVYQGHAGGLGVQTVRQVGDICTDGVTPDCVFLLDMPVELAAERMQRPRDRMESQGDRFQSDLRGGFLAEAVANPDTIHIIDAAQNVDAVMEQVQLIAQPLLASHGNPV